ncbi:uncharacterized protein LOC110022893 isoform X2 [Phalaenopsis equestris]|uniref:uncharacterized protein LOC110022893 isoform X2 n=1 Tax=Phalaenopsis equestris TaxID=78828 RepID=UPI0009E4B2E0|nr:uncharacterized protein LOC110022893 isoform X2 [Phalaenopsis equestris]
METAESGPDRIDSEEPSNTPTVDNAENSIGGGNSKEQPLPAKDEKKLHTDLSHDSNPMDPSRNVPLGSVNTSGDHGSAYTPNLYAPHAQTFVYGGYENTNGEWEEYPHHFLHAEGFEPGSTGFYTENQSVMFHPGYGYNPQMPYGPYSPVTTPLPASGRDGQLYSPQHFPFTGPYYHQPATPNMSYLHAPSSIPQADLTVPLEQQGASLANLNSSSILLGPTPAYHVPFSSFDWLKSPDGVGSLTPLLSPAASPQPIGAVGSFGQGMMPPSSGMACQPQRSFYGFGSSINSYDQGYFHGGMYHHGSNFGGSISSLGNNGRNLLANDKVRRRGKGNTSTCNSCNDFLNEQNRGPRASRPKNANIEQALAADNKNSNVIPGVNRELYNRPDFAVEYMDAKFFIIKSYSEDNVHKSIKYGVWASTANGNKKLDAAYRETKEKGDFFPVFLFFSVNASAQFVGVAEMIGPVDFDRSVDYWQQDKWSGQFPVKWHIIKDVPNSLFRHIILENNDNKPVTNSRDTQEVKLEQGLEMLSILKNYESDLSILDDFAFYEDRQKSMQERKARQQLQLSPTPDMVDGRQPPPASRSSELISQISKNFAEVVRLDKVNGEGTDKSNTSVANSEDAKKPTSSTAS